MAGYTRDEERCKSADKPDRIRCERATKVCSTSRLPVAPKRLRLKSENGHSREDVEGARTWDLRCGGSS